MLNESRKTLKLVLEDMLMRNTQYAIRNAQTHSQEGGQYAIRNTQCANALTGGGQYAIRNAQYANALTASGSQHTIRNTQHTMRKRTHRRGGLNAQYAIRNAQTHSQEGARYAIRNTQYANALTADKASIQYAIASQHTIFNAQRKP